MHAYDWKSVALGPKQSAVHLAGAHPTDAWEKRSSFVKHMTRGIERRQARRPCSHPNS